LVFKKEKKNVAFVLASFFFFPTNYVNKNRSCRTKRRKGERNGIGPEGNERGRKRARQENERKEKITLKIEGRAGLFFVSLLISRRIERSCRKPFPRKDGGGARRKLGKKEKRSKSNEETGQLQQLFP
jgi:hypothetical protein